MLHQRAGPSLHMVLPSIDFGLNSTMELLPPSEDRLMALPDDVLVLILEKLGGGAREAIRTCSLVSRRWSRLPWLLPEPKISIQDFLPRGTELHDELAPAELGRAMGAFCRAVSSFLSNSNAIATTGSRCLNLEFVLANGCLPAIQRLLGGDAGGTAAGKASALKFSIRTAAHETDCGEAPMRRYARWFKRFMAASSGAFRLLASLELWNLWLGSAGVAAVLGACPRLQRLALRHCHTTSADSRRGEVLVIDDAPTLGELVVDMCFYRLVELRSAPKLTRLTCDMWTATGAPLSLTGAPGLETLVLVNGASRFERPFRLSELLVGTTNLRCLSLNFQSEKIWIQPEPPRSLYTAFGKLTALSIGGIFTQCDFLWMMILLEAARFLQEFRIAVQKHLCSGGDYKERREPLWRKQSDFKHNHLVTLQITGFEAQDKHIGFVRLVMERAINLKTVVLVDEEPCSYCGFANDPTSSSIESKYPKNEDEKGFTVKQLKAELSSSAQIVMR
ncbi:unnamed protein product [Urochloa decumbens]|uniref:At1g61320/AtMIF1 LRR domain-containing protein n=1 Tax=Urochloa decumbens TaxID=240449 RepID=A0ABC8ZLZ1_9POAL